MLGLSSVLSMWRPDCFSLYQMTQLASKMMVIIMWELTISHQQRLGEQYKHSLLSYTLTSTRSSNWKVQSSKKITRQWLFLCGLLLQNHVERWAWQTTNGNYEVDRCHTHLLYVDNGTQSLLRMSRFTCLVTSTF